MAYQHPVFDHQQCDYDPCDYHMGLLGLKKKLINTYNQGDAVITQYTNGKGLIDLDGTAYEEVETYKDGVWCDTQLVEA